MPSPSILNNTLISLNLNNYIYNEFVKGNIITPYKRKKNSSLTEQQELFNYHHAALRSRVERIFGLITNQFSILKTVMDFKPSKI